MKNKICKISLFSAILACVTNMPVDAAIKTKNSNRSYANAYNEVAAQQQQAYYYDANSQVATTASATANLPVMVDDKKLAESIANNTSTTTNIAELEACSMIYPNGVFKWSYPESGVRMNQEQQCVAVVELRDANSNAILATTTVAAGDSMKCNVDMFPQSGLLPAISNVELPNDEAPTLADVEKVMNEEQKQNAGIKIAAAAIIGGIAGNMLAPKNAGDTKIMGTSKTQLMDTAIGMTASAGVMAASTYSGKVAGDTIKSTAVNAASGMVIGNMAAGLSGGDSVLSIKKCVIPKTKEEKDCVVGNLVTKGESINTSTGNAYLISRSGSTIICNQPIKNCSEYKDGSCGNDKHCKLDNGQCTQNVDVSGRPIALTDCKPTTKPLNIVLAGNISFEDITKSQDKFAEVKPRYVTATDNSTNLVEANSNDQEVYLPIQSANLVKSAVHAYAVYDKIPHKAMGYKEAEFKTNSIFNNPVIYARNTDGSVGRCLENCSGITTKEETKSNEKEKTGAQILTPKTEESTETDSKVEFMPSNKDASDGGLVDINNEARAKATLIGTAAGGALGGFAGYQGAKTEIEQRWVEAVRTYNDSLSNFVCMTGGRYLAKYNDYVEIPALKKDN